MANKYDSSQGKYVNKVVFGNEVIMDITDADAAVADVASGKKFYSADGALKTGTSTKDVDSSGATAQVAEVLTGKTFAAGGSMKTGTMPNIGQQTGTISTKAGIVSISQGYHDGSGTVGISSTEQAKIIAANIREGVTILGVQGSMSGSEDVKATTASITPYTTSQTVLPTDLGDYNYISQVNVAAIAYSETANATGLTATIGTVAPSA